MHKSSVLVPEAVPTGTSVVMSVRVKSYFFKKIIFSIIDIDTELFTNMNVYKLSNIGSEIDKIVK